MLNVKTSKTKGFANDDVALTFFAGEMGRPPALNDIKVLYKQKKLENR